MSSGNRPRGNNKPGRREREAIRQGRQPQTETEAAYADRLPSRPSDTYRARDYRDRSPARSPYRRTERSRSRHRDRSPRRRSRSPKDRDSWAPRSTYRSPPRHSRREPSPRRYRDEPRIDRRGDFRRLSPVRSGRRSPLRYDKRDPSRDRYRDDSRSRAGPSSRGRDPSPRRYRDVSGPSAPRDEHRADSRSNAAKPRPRTDIRGDDKRPSPPPSTRRSPPRSDQRDVAAAVPQLNLVHRGSKSPATGQPSDGGNMGPPALKPIAPVSSSASEGQDSSSAPKSAPEVNPALQTPAAQQAKAASQLPTPLTHGNAEVGAGSGIGDGSEFGAELGIGDDVEMGSGSASPEKAVGGAGSNKGSSSSSSSSGSEDPNSDDDFFGAGGGSSGGSAAGGDAKGKEASSGKDKGETGLGAVAEFNRLSPKVKEKLISAIFESGDEHSLGRVVKDLLEGLFEDATQADVDPHRHSINLAPECNLHVDDILSLFFLEGEENAAWFTQEIPRAVLSLERRDGTVDHLEFDLLHFLDRGYIHDFLPKDIEGASATEQKEPSMGWPFIDLKSTHKRIILVVNPSGVHWVTVEIIFAQGNEPFRLLYYNSLRDESGHGSTIKMVTEWIPRLLYLASLRPGSPLAGFSPYTLEVTQIPCPEQANVYDCGPWAIYFAAKRLHNQQVWRDLPTLADRENFGTWLRLCCANILSNRWVTGASNRSLLSAFRYLEEDPIHEELEELDANQPNALEEGEWAEQALLQQFLAVENHAVGLEPAPPRDSPVPEGETASKWRLLSTATVNPIIRIEIGEASIHATTVILVIRWSSYVSWWYKYRDLCLYKQEDIDLDYFRRVVEDLAQDRLAKYLQTMGIEDANTHLIIYAGSYIKTRYVPCLAMEDLLEDPLGDKLGNTTEHTPQAPQEEMLEDADEAVPADHVVVICPFHPACTATWQFRSQDGASLNIDMRKVYRHIATTHMPRPVKIQTGGSHVKTYKCSWEGCGYTHPVKGNGATRMNQHVADKHVKDCLQENDLQIIYECHCSDNSCQRQFADWSKLRKHIDGKEMRPAKQCPLCSSKLKSKWANHFSEAHWQDEQPDGWFRCEHVLQSDISDKTWSELHATIRERLVRLSDVCEWAAAGEDCGSTQPFKNNKQKGIHYDDEHANSMYPYTNAAHLIQCAKCFQTAESLGLHQARAHGKPIERADTADRQYDYRLEIASKWTQEITSDLTDACRRQSASKPTLMSNGVDGFTCNSELMLTWLQDINLDFTFAIVADELPTRDATHFTVGSTNAATYESNVLQAALADRSTAPENYVALLELWDRQQSNKDETRDLHARRNIRAMDGVEDDFDSDDSASSTSGDQGYE